MYNPNNHRDSLQMEYINVKDKVILITGSIRGIGNTLANGFARTGAKIINNCLEAYRVK